MTASTHRIVGNSNDYGWGPTEDGQGMVVWKGDWHQIFDAHTKIQFDDCAVEPLPHGGYHKVMHQVHGGGKIWGDPHFVGADGGKFDLHGEHGKYYNILSDAGVQVNAKFGNWGTKGATIMSEFGVVVDGELIAFNRNGQIYVDGHTTSKDGSYLDGSAIKKGNTLTVTTDEYDIVMHIKTGSIGTFLNIDFESENVAADGVLPHGIWGQTADGDGIARNGDTGNNAQGGGAIEDANGNITAKGDKEAFKIYEVDGLFDTTFAHHNNYYDHVQVNTNGVVDADGEAGEPTEEGGNNDTTDGTVFKIDGNSADYGWGPTLDNSGIVVWKGEWFQILEKGTQLQFNDKLASTDALGMDLGELKEDGFVAAGSSDEFGWGKTLDGEGYVIWQGEEFDLLYNVDQIVFTDTTVELDAFTA